MEHNTIERLPDWYQIIQLYFLYTVLPDTNFWFGLGLWCLMTFSTIFQLYHGSQ